MAYEKLKSESYQLLGGMNNKASPYNNSPMEFRELTNMQFTAPGAIDKRQGSTLFFQGSSTKILGLFEYEKLDGSSYLLFNDANGVYKTSLAGSTLLGGYTLQSIYPTNIQGTTFAGNIGGKADFTSFVDWVFLGLNGQTTTSINNPYSLRKTDGNTLFIFGLPRVPPLWGTAATSIISSNVIGLAGGSLSAGVTAAFKVTCAYINNRGFIGPAQYDLFGTLFQTSPYHEITIDGSGTNSLVFSGLVSPSTSASLTTNTYFGGLNASYAAFYGISSIGIFCSLPNQTTPFYLTSIALNTQTFVIDNLTQLSEISANDYGYVSYGAPSIGYPGFEINQMYPSSFTEVFNNQLFLGGFNGPDLSLTGGASEGKKFFDKDLKSNILYSTIGEPENISITQNIEVRTNDGDEVTGLKAYNNALVITKNRSIHQLNGQDPDNFVLNQVTDQYGCVNNRAMVIFEDVLWMLDRKGIIQYNGANVIIASTKMDSIFARMNYKYAQREACATYHKAINQVWFSFPVDNAEENNMTVVFDIITKQWTKFEGFKPAVTTIAQSSLSIPQMFYGGYSGGIFHFSESYMVDYGASGMTCLFQTPYYAPTGHTTERQFRRFYLDVDPITGSSVPIQLNFLPNFGTTVGHTAQIYQNPFQSRIDFGIPAKSLSVQAKFFSATHSLKVNGYTFESRYQRNV